MEAALPVEVESKDLVVLRGPKEDEIAELVYTLLVASGGCCEWGYIKKIFTCVASENKLRRALRKLIREGRAYFADREGWAYCACLE